ncbi:MAG: hypothetical protein ABLQ96_01955 [Candidatus Acidiferrum sp.]
MCGEEEYASAFRVQRAEWKWIFRNGVGSAFWGRLVLRWRLRLPLIDIAL